MEVHFMPELEKKLNDLAALSGRPAEELVQDAVAGLVDEQAGARQMLDRRYDDLKAVESTPSMEKRFSRVSGSAKTRIPVRLDERAGFHSSS